MSQPPKRETDALPKHGSLQSQLGQFMTPVAISEFMADMFQEPMTAQVRLLDAGAGCGALATAFVKRWGSEASGGIEVHAYEFDEAIARSLREGLAILEQQDKVETRLIVGDFLEIAANMLRFERGPRYTHAILNPPYKKIGSISRHRDLLRLAGLETVNLYSGFVGLALNLMEIGGQLVAIIPRSFCNGPYYKPFRALLTRKAAINQIHLFSSRDKAFKADAILQENVIIYLERGAKQADLTVSTSTDGTFSDYKKSTYSFPEIIAPDDPELIINIPVEAMDIDFGDAGNFRFSLEDTGVDVSTGPVVDFRLKDWLCHMPEEGTVPLLYPGHFTAKGIVWPMPTMKKANAIRRTADTEKWLYEKGFYVVVRRFSSKEERRRIVASVVDPRGLPGDALGFENHLNVFHQKRRPLPESIALGLSTFLNTTAVDKFFRQFNGHTQVNATDLRLMKYPSRQELARLGEWAMANPEQNQEAIDRETTYMSINHEHIRSALTILADLGFPSAQLNERSALVLLAVLDLRPDRTWQDAAEPLLGITPIMGWLLAHYNKQYAANTRETIRRQTIHQFVDAGLVIYNPDKPDRAVNSPDAVYQISPEALVLMRTYGSPKWSARLTSYLSKQQGLAARYAHERDMQRIPVNIGDGQVLRLSPGEHSLLIKQIIEDFGDRFVKEGQLIYAGDTGEKMGHFRRELLQGLGVAINDHGKMPDVVLYCPKRNWLLLIEAVTSHGPVDGKRHNELARLFAGSKAGLVYVTAFPSKAAMARYVTSIAWETEVWVADAPSHLIHFDGVRFLGPYPARE